MPQASDETRGHMERLFGDPIDDSGPMSYLRDKGWKLSGDWFYSHPLYTTKNSIKDIPTDEWVCIVFLVHEWDHAGWKPWTG